MPIPKGFVEKALAFPVGRCDRRSFRIKVVSKDKRLVVCCPKKNWDNKRKRCRVGTRAAKMQVRRKRA